MCRLFALRCQEEIPICRSLIGGDNSFAVQSLEHPDGWGLAYYIDGAPHIAKSILPAISDQQFERISLSVESSTLLAHLRRATTGSIANRNCHPFQFGAWVFAHNGFIRNFAAIKTELCGKISPRLKKYIIGETDSEVFFFLFLTHLGERAALSDVDVPETAMARALARAIDDIRGLADTAASTAPDSPDRSWLSVLVTNGAVMLSARFGRSMAFQHTARRSKRELVLFSSEIIGGLGAGDDDAWVDLEEGHYAFVDAGVGLRHASL